MELLHDGAIGKVYMARGLCFKRRPSIGHTPRRSCAGRAQLGYVPGTRANAPVHQESVPIQLALVLGHRQRRHRQSGHSRDGHSALGHERGLPKGVVSTGGKFVYDDDQETPNTQIATFDYGDAEIVFEVRGLNTGGEPGIAASGPNFIGVTFFGSKGFMAVDEHGYQIFLGDKREPGEPMKHAEKEIDDTIPHMANFVKAVKSRNAADLTADVAVGTTSAALVHMANISYRLGRKLTFDSTNGTFLDDAAANAMSTRPVYRSPYVVS